jgi:hypothetical protein
LIINAKLAEAMKKKPKNNAAEYDPSEPLVWIKKIIDSCENTFHFEGAQVIMDKFKEICEDERQWVEIEDYFSLKYN